VATRQHGVVGRRQLLALGFGEGTIKRWLKSGRLHRLHREAYAVGHARVDRRGRWLAAVLACAEGATLSHRSAAELWGLARARSGRIDVNAQAGRQFRPGRLQIRLHRCKIDPEEATRREGIPVTTVARTLFDFAEVTSQRELAAAAEEADRLKLLRLRELERICELRRGRRALRPVRRLLEELRPPADGRSPLELRFAVFVRQQRLPRPVQNVHVLGHEVDALWPAAKLVVELDSWEHHGHRSAFERDRARDPKLLLAGYRTLRVTHRRLDREADALAAEVRQLLRSERPPAPAA
jgi:very-short-patch-repair endonuclease/predicted transcriptional regulator of viral defense system